MPLESHDYPEVAGWIQVAVFLLSFDKCGAETLSIAESLCKQITSSREFAILARHVDLCPNMDERPFVW